MRVPLRWLREYVDVPAGETAAPSPTGSPASASRSRPSHDVDVAGPLVVGRVLEVADEPQSNGKTIRWCQVDVGDAQRRGRVARHRLRRAQLRRR